MNRVVVPSPLRSYTGERAAVSAQGSTLDGVLRDLDRQFPGIRFRMIDEQDAIRVHIKLFVNGVLVRDLAGGIAPGAELVIVTAISGG